MFFNLFFRFHAYFSCSFRGIYYAKYYGGKGWIFRGKMKNKGRRKEKIKSKPGQIHLNFIFNGVKKNYG